MHRMIRFVSIHNIIHPQLRPGFAAKSLGKSLFVCYYTYIEAGIFRSDDL